MPKAIKNTIRNKVNIIAAIVLLGIFLILFFYIKHSYFQQIEQIALQTLTDNKNEYSSRLSNDSIKFTVAIEFISRNEKIKDLFIEKNRPNLFNYCLQEFNNLKTKFEITHWYFIQTEPANTCFLRVHRPEKHSDTINRATFLNTVRTKMQSTGLELGSRALAYRVVQPYFRKNTLIGYLEISRDLDDFSEQMKTTTKDEYALLISKKYLNKNDWENARKQYPKMSEWSEMPNDVIIDRTEQIINFKSINYHIDSVPDQGRIIHSNFIINNESHVIGVFPIFDATQQKIGVLMYIHKVGNLYNEVLYHFTTLAIIFLIISIIVVFIFIKFYIIQLKAQNRFLEKKVYERTTEIKFKNQQLLQQNEEVKAQSEELAWKNQELAKLSIVVRETDNSVIIIDKQMNFIWVNNAFEKFYGLSLEELVKQNGTINLIAYSQKKDIQAIVNECISKQKSIFYETESILKNGDRRWIQTLLTPVLDETGEHIEQIIAVESDITKIKEANIEISIKKGQIESSLRYAETIQQAILPFQKELNSFFKEIFILYKPKDIISGDFYWFANIKDPKRLNGLDSLLFIVVADCTGHGVPGALMSMIGNQLLNEIVNEKHVNDPAEILKQLDNEIKQVLKQEQTDNTDGMDVCLCKIENSKDTLTEIVFSGAKRPLYHYHSSEKKIIRIKGSSFSIGGFHKTPKKFDNKFLTMATGDMLYLSSDGFVDQSSPKRIRFGTKQFLKLLTNSAILPAKKQKELTENAIKSHMKTENQRDDITLIGIKF